MNTDSLVEPEYLFNRLLSGIRAEKLDPLGARKWTGAVKRTLRAMAREIDPNITVYPNDDSSEFLLDLIWLKAARPKVDSNGKIILAVECEWGGVEAAWYDFSKLLYVRSPRKLLVCCLSPKALGVATRQFETDLRDVGGVEPHEKYIIANFGNECAEYRWCDASQPIAFRNGPQEQW